ncbi:polysaccharide export outer membrane protein [Bryocella elongata]|uniref:Polysaccharide export outer membrane protein n=1 Tax=Bryocella elongata TaxID=863522 RepID=A0A1H6AVX5_9BACT|nr:polysaccharide biosynthesis/export family protein [Bryocella elongata]SEG52444.1 polysaccharide export outer membrane protein [Bryocella elongata]
MTCHTPQRIDRIGRRALSSVACALLLASAWGTSQAQKGGPSDVPSNQASQTLQLRALESAPDAPYQLGKGDAIVVNFGGRPEMDSKQVVGPDGKITLPIAGSILVAGRTREEAATSIATALEPYYPALTVTVGVEKYTSNQVMLLGAVEHPGLVTFDRAPTLLEVIARGGALESSRTTHADASYNMTSNLTARGPAVPERVAIYRGTDKVVWVDLKQLLDSGSPLAAIRLERDDIVYVPSAAERYVSVLGSVQHAGAIQLDDSSTVAKLIGLAGGFTPDAGRYPQIQIISTTTGKTRTISFKEVLEAHNLDLTLHSGDVLYIPMSGFNRVAYTLDKLSPLVTMFTAGAFLTH